MNDTTDQPPFPDIFNYGDWRLFLKDTIQWHKDTDPKFSFRNFCQQAGQKSHAYVHKLINGEGTLTLNLASLLAYALKLNVSQTNKFLQLVLGDDATVFEHTSGHIPHPAEHALCTALSSAAEDPISPESLSSGTAGVVSAAAAANWLEFGLLQGFISLDNGTYRLSDKPAKTTAIHGDSEEEVEALQSSISKMAHQCTVNQRVKSINFANFVWLTKDETDDLTRSINKEFQRVLAAATNTKDSRKLHYLFFSSSQFPKD